MTALELGKSQGMDQATDPSLLPLAKALGEVVQSILPARMSFVPMVRIVNDLPQAQALVRFDQKEIYVRAAAFAGVDAQDVGTTAWLLRFSDVFGLILHEVGHWIYSPKDFNDFAHIMSRADERRVLILFEEARVESCITRYWEAMGNHGSGETVVKARIYTHVLRQSIYASVLRDITPQGKGWQDLSEVMLLVMGRVWGGSARHDDPRLTEIMDAVLPLFTMSQIDRAKSIVRSYLHLTGVGIKMCIGADGERELYGRIQINRKHQREDINNIVQHWIALMKEVAGEDRDEESEGQESEGQESEGQDGNPVNQESDDDGELGQESDSQESNGKDSEGDNEDSDDDGQAGQDSDDDNEDSESGEQKDKATEGGGKGSDKGPDDEKWEKFKEKMNDLIEESPNDNDFSPDSDSKSDLRDSLAELEALDALEVAKRRSAMPKYQDAWN